MYKEINKEAGTGSFYSNIIRIFSLESQGKPRLVALKITIIYVLFGAVWVILSDRFLSIKVDNKEFMTLFGIIKGCIFVLTTGGLIYIFSCNYLKKIKLAGDEISNNYQQLKNVHDKLLESEKFIRVIIDKMLNAFALHRIILDDKGKPCDYEFVDVNQAFESFTGLNKEDIIGKKYSDLILDKETTDWVSVYGKVALSGEPVVFESYTYTFDKWLIVNAYSPKEGYFITVFNDISEIKKSEAELRDSEERFRLAAEGSNDMIWDLDLLTGKCYISDRWYDFLGYPKIQNENL
ncbi:MAG: PAS domain S-box protein, partial [Clostridiaceae bacterium]|nr:PAS domain S-box protein [Clostridiaceae bacterium]